MKVQDIGILIVDDVNAIRVQIKEVLRKVGFEKIWVAANGTEAMEIMVNQPVSCVLSDWHMSPMDGLALLKWIRKHSEFHKLPFIMVTAESAREEVVKVVIEGVDDYIVKPLTVEQVHEKLFKTLIKKKVLL